MRVCRALLPLDDAQDAAAETFVSALRAYPRLRPDSDVRAWLVTIAHRKALDVLRAPARVLPVADGPEPPPPPPPESPPPPAAPPPAAALSPAAAPAGRAPGGAPPRRSAADGVKA